MTTDSAHRSVRLERIENSRYTAINERGGKITIGTGAGTDFTPVELLLVAIGGCTAVDVDILTSRRAGRSSWARRSRPRSIRALAIAEPSRPAGRTDPSGAYPANVARYAA